MSDTARLHGWIARASFPEERLRCSAFTAADAQDAVVVEDRCASWAAVFVAGDGDDSTASVATTAALSALKTDLLRARGLTESEWRAGLRDYVVCAPAALPAWARVFSELYQTWRDAPAAAATVVPPRPHLLLTAVWAAQSRAWAAAQADGLRAAGIRLTDAAVDDLLEYLTLRLATPVFAPLSAWPGAWQAGDGDGDGHGGDDDTGDDHHRHPRSPHHRHPRSPHHRHPRSPLSGGGRWNFLRTLEFWEAALDRQPILAHIIGHLTQLWRESTSEMLTRFKTDLPRLRAAGFLRAGAGAAITVTRLRCGLGDPHRGGRSVAIVETDCGDVVYKPKDLTCTRATGRLLRELHALQPPGDEFAPLTPAFLHRRGYGWEQCARARECESVAQVETFYRRLGGWQFLLQLLNGNDFWYDNLIACGDMPTFIDYETVVGNSFTDHFTRGEHHARDEQVEMFYQMQMVGILPLLMPGAVDGALADGIDISVATKPGKQRVPFAKDAAGFFTDFEASDYAPFYRGAFQDMNDYLERFIDGYRRMASLLDSKPGRGALQRFRRRIKRARFRHIVIDTWSCYALLRAVFGNCRTDGARAAILLDGACARFCRYPRAVVAGMRRDLWRNDVPLFEMQTDSLKLFNTAGEATAEDFFAATALAKITRNRRYLRANLDAQVARIKALFSTRPDGPRRRWRPAGDATPAPVSQDEMLTLAAQTGAKLAADLNRVDALQNYLAIGRVQRNNITVVQPLPADGYGAAGAVVFLSRVRQYVDADAIAAIDAALARCGSYLREDHAPRMLHFEARELMPAAALSGPLSAFGAELIALSCLAELHLESGHDLTAHIERMMNTHLDNLTAAKVLCADYRHGACGLLCRWPDLARLFADDTVAAWLARILTAIESKPLQLAPPQTDSYRHYADALAADAAQGMRFVERMLRAQWPAFAAHAGMRKLQRFIAEHSEAKPSTAPSPSPSLRESPGEALLDRAYQNLGDGDGDYRDNRAQPYIAELIARRRASGRWFPDRWADDAFWPGALHGLADIGLLLLGQARGANLNPLRAPAPTGAA